MNNTNDKDQYRFQINCATCLSVGRKMYSLKIYLDIFESIMSKVLELDKKFISRNNICWECFSLLRNVRRFQKKASKAHKLLENKHMQNSSLSTLCSETINETIEYGSSNNTQPFNTKIVTQIKDEIKKVKDETEILKNNSDQETEQYFDEVSVDLSKKKVNHKKTKSKWALKHSLLKRKPKFKSFHNSNNIEFNFTRLQLSEIEILNSVYAKDNENSFGKNKSTCSSINTDDSIKRHKMTVIGTLGEHFICDICNAKIKTKCNLIRHVTDHYYKYECKWCQYVGYRKDEVKEHLEMHKKLIKCLRCGIVCGSSQEFLVHYRDLHETYTCHYCGVTFKMRYCIKDHIRRKHSAFKCKTCSKEFKRYNALWLHNKIRHSAVQTKAYCNVCDKHFVDIYRYKWHLANSVQHKPRKKVKVPCPDCEKVFTKNIYMKDHYNLVHLKVFKYRCEDCDKNFIRNADLLKHKRRVHEGILPPKDKICHHCGQGFTTNKILGNHLRTHAKSTEKKLLI